MSTEDRYTLRVFYAHKEKTPQKRPEDALEARVAELEAYIVELEDALLAGAP